MAKLFKGKSWLSTLLVIGLITIFSGCNGAGLDSQTRQTLQNTIDMLGSQPDQWQNTMDVTIDKLGTVGTASAKLVLADVQSTYNSALGQTGGEVSCRGDYIGRRLQQRLEAILHKYDKTAPEPTIVPVICSINPDHIEAGPNPPQTQLVTYYGYDFQEFNKNQNFTTDLQYGSGQIVKQNFGFVNIPHNYELTLDIQAANYTGVDRNQGPAVVLKWGSQKVGTDSGQSALPVLIPTPTPAPKPLMGVQVNAHVQNIGWMGWATNPDSDANYAGKLGLQILQMEAVQIRLVNASAGVKVCYTAHIQNSGWMNSEVCDGDIAGTTGGGARMEAIKIRLVNAPPGMHINYRAYVAGAWLPWQSDGDQAGTTGVAQPMQAMNVKITGQ